MTRIRAFTVLSMTVLSLAHASVARADVDLCDGKKAGSITFYNQEIGRDKPLPTPATEVQFNKNAFALMCLIQAVGPQPSGGKSFRVDLYVNGKQSGGPFRPGLSKPRRDIIVAFEDAGWLKNLKFDLDAGTYEFRLQGVTETPTDKIDIQANWVTDMVYIQQLRKAGYIADGKTKVKVTK